MSDEYKSPSSYGLLWAEYQGYRAYHSDDALVSENPYSEDSQLYQCWVSGYNQADFDAAR